MRWALVTVALCLVGCAKKDRAEGVEKSPTGASTQASAGVCGPESTALADKTSCGQTTGHDCNASCGCEQGGQKKADGPILPVSEAKPGDRTRCLVTNTVFRVTNDSPSVEHDGKKYFFCCEGCADKFKSAPAKFLGS
jgi:hypothetical protein